MKKLIEVAIPLDAINKASAREKSIRHGHPSTLHLWWARRPLATARAVLFASLIDDPSEHPEKFPTPEAQEIERQRLFKIIGELVSWESSGDEKLFARALAEIKNSIGDELPAVLDPFAGGGTIPLEAQRLGLKAFAADLNPVAVMINKAMIELPAQFKNRPPVNPTADKNKLGGRLGAEGLAEDILYYGKLLKSEAFKQIGNLYPKIYSDEHKTDFTVIAWLWARTVPCSNPACGHRMPLVHSFKLSTKQKVFVAPIVDGDKIRFEIRHYNDVKEIPAGTVDRNGARCLFCETDNTLAHVRTQAKSGNMSAQLMAIVAEGERGRIYLAPDQTHEKIADVPKPDDYPEGNLPDKALGFRVQEYGITEWHQLFTNRQLTALTTFSDLIDDVKRQILADCGDKTYADALAVYLSFLIDKLVDYSNNLCIWHNSGEKISHLFGRQTISMQWDFAEANPFSNSSGCFDNMLDWIYRSVKDLPAKFSFSSCSPGSFSSSISSSSISSSSISSSSISRSSISRSSISSCSSISRSSISASSISASSISASSISASSISSCSSISCSSLSSSISSSSLLFRSSPSFNDTVLQIFSNDIETPASRENFFQHDAQKKFPVSNVIVSTDPPYYDNIGYANLSEFFYVWLRRSLKSIYPKLFGRMTFAKNDELIAEPARHSGDSSAAKTFFEDGMFQALQNIYVAASDKFPITIYYAFKQRESEDGASTGWETMLTAIIRAGFQITGTWPMRTEMKSRMRSHDSNALATSVVLVCRKRPPENKFMSRNKFLATLKTELKTALDELRKSNIAPVDMAQAAIGPGIAVYSRYEKIADMNDVPVTVRDALTIIASEVDEYFNGQGERFDNETQFCIALYTQLAFNEIPFGDADNLARAKNTSVDTLNRIGAVISARGRVRLRDRDEIAILDRNKQLNSEWLKILVDGNCTWLWVQALVEIFNVVGIKGGGELLANYDGEVDRLKNLAYLLYEICEKKKRVDESNGYNHLVAAWDDILRERAEYTQKQPDKPELIKLF